jgi:hypothetical protein
VFFIPQTTVEVLIVYKDQTVALDLEPQASMLSVRYAIRDMARKSLLGKDLPSLRFQRIVGAGRRIMVLPVQELKMRDAAAEMSVSMRCRRRALRAYDDIG